MIITSDDVTSGRNDADQGGYGRLRGECVLITKPKSCLLPIFSPDFTLNSQIRLFYAEKWIFLKKLCTLLKIRNGHDTDYVREHSYFT